MTPEGRVKAAIKKALKGLGPACWVYWPVPMGMGGACLDCHGCYRGASFAIEVKAPGKRPTDRQRATLEAIREAGGLALVVDSIERAHELPNELRIFRP